MERSKRERNDKGTPGGGGGGGGEGRRIAYWSVRRPTSIPNYVASLADLVLLLRQDMPSALVCSRRGHWCATPIVFLWLVNNIIRVDNTPAITTSFPASYIGLCAIVNSWMQTS